MSPSTLSKFRATRTVPTRYFLAVSRTFSEPLPPFLHASANMSQSFSNASLNALAHRTMLSHPPASATIPSTASPLDTSLSASSTLLPPITLTPSSGEFCAQERTISSSQSPSTKSGASPTSATYPRGCQETNISRNAFSLLTEDILYLLN